MIHAKVTYGRGGAFSLTAEGHAHAARNENGRDLVCCAVSTIFGTLANSCTQLDGVNTTYHNKPGYGHIVVTGVPENLWGVVDARFQMAADGLAVLAIQYPDSIRVEENE